MNIPTSIIVLVFLVVTIVAAKKLEKDKSELHVEEIEKKFNKTADPPQPYGCKDDAGKYVDWYVMYKYPRRHNIPPTWDDSRGRGYFYLTSQTCQSEPCQWMHKPSINSATDSHLYRTLSDDKAGTNYVTYNNDIGNKNPKKTEYAHAKGALWWKNDYTGFWLIHSAPAFWPAPNRDFNYPDSATVYGQIFFCLSFDTKETLEVLTQHLADIKVNKLGSDLPPAVSLFFRSSEIGPFTVFTRGLSATEDRDIYDYAQSVFQDESMEDLEFKTVTWNNDPRATTNVPRVSIPKGTEAISWGTDCLQGDNKRQDHAKWAIWSTTAASPVHTQWCIGDLNRMEDDKIRIHDSTGGLLCFKNELLANAFNRIIVPAV